jgi:hypothetical protein
LLSSRPTMSWPSPDIIELATPDDEISVRLTIE